MSRLLSPQGEAVDALSYYALGEPPFDLSPDPRFFFASQSQARALRQVTAALSGHDTLVMVTGSPGVGKSTLCNQLVEQLPAPAKVVAITATTSDDVLAQILEGVAEGADASIPAEADAEARRQQMFLSLQRRLTDRLADRRAVVLVDDAHRLRPDALDWLLVLSNLAMATVPLLRVVLVGPPQLDLMLRDARSRELAPRSVVQCRLGGLGRSEVGPYITQRLRVGSHDAPAFDKTRPPFTGAAIRALSRVSAGVPATINQVAARALAIGAGQRLPRIGGAVIRRAAEGAGLAVRRGTTLRIAAASAAMALAVLMLGLVAWSWRSGGQAVLPNRDVTIAAPAPAVPNAAAAASPAPPAGAPDPAGTTPDLVTPPAPVQPVVPEPSARVAAVPSTDTPREERPHAGDVPAADAVHLVLAGSFRSMKNADGLVAALVAGGLPAFARHSATGGWHRVYVGPYATSGEARAVLPRVQTEFGLKDAAPTVDRPSPVVPANGPPAAVLP